MARQDKEKNKTKAGAVHGNVCLQPPLLQNPAHKSSANQLAASNIDNVWNHSLQNHSFAEFAWFMNLQLCQCCDSQPTPPTFLPSSIVSIPIPMSSSSTSFSFSNYPSNSPLALSVPQVSILGPLLFSNFTADFVEVFENKLSMYTDDFTLYARIRSAADRAEVEANLN